MIGFYLCVQHVFEEGPVGMLNIAKGAPTTTTGAAKSVMNGEKSRNTATPTAFAQSLQSQMTAGFYEIAR